MIFYSSTSFQLDYTTLTNIFYNRRIFEQTQEYQMALVNMQSSKYCSLSAFENLNNLSHQMHISQIDNRLKINLYR
jgi:hypothetical protein